MRRELVIRILVALVVGGAVTLGFVHGKVHAREVDQLRRELSPEASAELTSIASDFAAIATALTPPLALNVPRSAESRLVALMNDEASARRALAGLVQRVDVFPMRFFTDPKDLAPWQAIADRARELQRASSEYAAAHPPRDGSIRDRLANPASRDDCRVILMQLSGDAADALAHIASLRTKSDCGDESASLVHFARLREASGKAQMKEWDDAYCAWLAAHEDPSWFETDHVEVSCTAFGAYLAERSGRMNEATRLYSRVIGLSPDSPLATAAVRRLKLADGHVARRP